MHRPAINATAAFHSLTRRHVETRERHMRSLFAQDPQRFAKFSLFAAELFLDYSKNRLDHITLQLLLELAREREVEAQRDAMFAGEKINRTEHRAVLHVALRTPRDSSFLLDGKDIAKDIHAVLKQIRSFTDRVRSGEWRGYSGKTITDVVNIGIGGSDLGPKMACQALRAFSHPRLTMHFVSNADGHDLDSALSQLNPETTLFIVASKTFSTAETMLNARSARNWFLRQGSEIDLARHFVAVSTNTDAVEQFGIDPDNMFPFWDWVGGRYSVWSAIGLPIALAVGFERFEEFLAGAHAMDTHFRSAPLEQNMPVLLALIGIWNRNFLGCKTLSVTPYHQDLCRFPAYLQQLDMESNGKRITVEGEALEIDTCPVIWGDVGTNGQHAYFQLLHQGTEIIPIDFIAALKPSHQLPGHHQVLLSNCFAQSEAFMRGKTAAEVRADLLAQGTPPDEIEALLPHRIFSGNRPSNTILMDALTPTTLGALIALYEHKTFVQGVIWGVNSFDQWGVELGKMLAKNIEQELRGEARPAIHDSSTNGLIAMAKAASPSL
jgi:glucose-6-phosphate isomerase